MLGERVARIEKISEWEVVVTSCHFLPFSRRFCHIDYDWRAQVQMLKKS
jgi:hypothetical protein